MRLNRYGDSSCEELREKLCEKYIPNFTKENVFIGAGSNEIIDLLIRGFVEPEEFIMAVEPTYTIYSIQASVAGVRCKKLHYDSNLSIPISSIRENMQGVKILFLCSPNNPTGRIISSNVLETILSFYKGIVIIDEAYIEFLGLDKSLVGFAHRSNVVITRSFSKAWGLAGIRVGYAIGCKKIIDVLLKIKNPYNVSKISQLIVMQALDQIDRMHESVSRSNNLKNALVEKLKTLPIDVFSTEANYILIRLNNAAKIQKTLAEKQIIVRDRGNLPLLKNILRISVGSADENKKFIVALTEIIETTQSSTPNTDMSG